MKVWAFVPLCAAISVMAGCGSSSPPSGTPGGTQYDVTVTRTSLGIPHIKAADYGSAGYGYGYAQAEDNLCVLQEDLVTIRGERARWFGREGSYQIVPNGVIATNINSDYFWKFSATDAAIAPTKERTPAEFRSVVEGYIAGYNRYVRELKSGGHAGRHASCRSADWLFEIESDDLYRRFYRLAVIASSSVFINEIAHAEPLLSAAKAAGAAAQPADPAAVLKADPGALRYFTEVRGKRFGSNMYAMGADATQDGSNLLWGNPHFPWTGTERLYLAHMTIPGELDIMGASLYGVPAALIGFNDHFAWSHTVSTAYRFTFYELTLNPADPFQYAYDSGFRDIEQVPVTIQVKETDGSLAEETRTLYRSHYGPMLVLEASGAPVLGWTNLKAYTLRDANAENNRLIEQFARWNQADSLDEFIDLHGQILGIPWVNTVATGPGGKAYYGDLSVVPNVSDAKVQSCGAVPINNVIGQLVPGLPVLDGSRSACEWDTDADAPAPGIFGRGNLPSLQRDDWVANNNDSYWLTHPEEPITGYARIIGDEGTVRSYRTQQSITQVQRRLDASDGRDATPGFTLPLLQAVGLSSAIKTAEYGLANVLTEICPSATGDEALACAALAQWDGSANLESVGAHVWREFFRALTGGSIDRGGDFWRVPFSADDPVNTPRDLDTSADAVKQAFTDGVAAVKASGFAFDATLGTIQHPCCIASDIPIFGGEFFEGAFTIASTTQSATNGLDASGYNVFYGNSYIQSVTWENGAAHAEGFITYSQSTDPASPHFADYTREYSAKRWHRLPFTDAAIAGDRIAQYRLTE